LPPAATNLFRAGSYSANLSAVALHLWFNTPCWSVTRVNSLGDQDMDFSEIKGRVAKLDTASAADANKQLRVMDFGIRPVRRGLKMIGPARTVRCKEDFLTVMKGLSNSVTGEVLVIETCGSRAAVAGELFSVEAARRGLAGIVIDGACRDIAKICTLTIPVYSRSVIPISGTSMKIFETQLPIICGGVTVNPGDIIFGDDDGIVVASMVELLGLLPTAEEIQAKEELILREMEAGRSLFTMLNFEEHWRNVSSGDKSKLQFEI
jgi:regulator of RNase E activity RraA